MIMIRKRDLIMEIPTSQSIGRKSVNRNVLIHHLVEEGTDGGVVARVMLISLKLR